ncbi:MAG: hypothetical protein A3B66_06955 [Alphaproteobacteria bacterium RIFCSPHIGHO2_02_FULL_46_13]|nr:MAG: hypothetical protein A3B66_06955 [Alphaproteobacteria bacterium RIFCSPHIGHO2_02_FULL_46_13]
MLNLSAGLGKTLIPLAFFLCLLGVIQVLFMAFPSAIWSVFALAIFGVYVCTLAKFTPVSFLLLLPYIFFRATTLLSGVAIESGGYMEDFETQGKATGAYIRLTAVYLIFISFGATIIEWGFNYLRSKSEDLLLIRERTQRHPWVWGFYAIFIIFSLYVIMIGLTEGFPFLTSADRLGFRDVGGRGYIFYMTNRMLAAYLFGIIIFLCSGTRRFMAIMLLISMIIISILFGEKFTSLILIAMYVVTPAYLMNKSLQGSILHHLIPAIGAVAVLTLPVILMVYGWSDRPQDALEKLSTRMVGQGEVWFIADRDTDDAFIFEGKSINHILVSTISPKADEMALEPPFMGVMYFMNNYMTPGMLSLFLERPALTLTFGFEPYLLVVFGWIGMILPLCFYAGVYAAGLLYLAWGIQKARPISIFIAGKLLIWMVVGLAQGYLFMIFGFKLLIMAGAAFLYELISSILSQKRNGN